VINEEERKLAGWVLLSPEEKGVKLSAKLEEKILLLVISDTRGKLTEDYDSHLRRIIQLSPRQGRRVHADSSCIDHDFAGRRLHLISVE